MPVIGRCRLCLAKGRQLRDSHIVPAWAYRRIMTGVERPANPVQIQDDVAILTSKQAKEHLLCHDCEQRLCGWEDYASKMLVQEDGAFPWLVESRDVAMALNGGEPLGYLDSSSLDAEALALFVTSVVWRASVSKQECPKVNLGPYEERFRRYLRGEAPFPSRANLIVYLQTVPLTALPSADRILTLPTQVTMNYTLHWFVLCGAAFYLLVGLQPPIFRRQCFARTRHVHTRPSDQLMSDLGQTSMGAKARGLLARRFPNRA